MSQASASTNNNNNKFPQQNASFQQAVRKADMEEQEDAFSLDQLHAHFFNGSDHQQGTIALSLPLDSYLAQNFYAKPPNNSKGNGVQHTKKANSYTKNITK